MEWLVLIFPAYWIAVLGYVCFVANCDTDTYVSSDKDIDSKVLEAKAELIRLEFEQKLKESVGSGVKGGVGLHSPDHQYKKP